MIRENIQIDMTWWKENLDNPLNLNFEARVGVVSIPETSYKKLEEAFYIASDKTGLGTYNVENRNVIEIYDPKTDKKTSKNLYKEIILGNIGITKARMLVRNDKIIDHLLLFRDKKTKKVNEYLATLCECLDKPD